MRAAALVLIAACSPASSGPAGGDGGALADGAGGESGRSEDRTFASDQGRLDYRVHLPGGYRAGAAVPLILVLSGCAQSIEQLEEVSRFSELAERHTFIAVYVAQSVLRNPAGCWNWFSPEDQARDRGEPSLLAGITGEVAATWSIDEERVHVIGPSAGGAMSVILGANYPDRFAAIGVIAGCEYSGAPCGLVGGPDPVEQGELAYRAMGSRARVVPVIAFQGQADAVVAPINGRQVAAQWVATDDRADNGVRDGSLPATPTATKAGQAPGGRTYSITEHGAPAVVELVAVDGAGHAWPGGPADADFSDPEGPDASTMSYQFFMSHPAHPPSSN